MMNTIQHVLCDLDGVLVAFSEEVQKLFGVEGVEVLDWRLERYLGVTEAEMWAKIDEAGSEFWANLPRYPWYPALISLISDYSWSISTTPSKHHSSSTGKEQWIDRNFGRDFTNHMLGKDKFRMAKPGVVLIDDKDSNCEQFEAHGGHAIVFPQPWNSRRAIARAGLRMAYVKDRMEEINEGSSYKDINWSIRLSESEVLV